MLTSNFFCAYPSALYSRQLTTKCLVSSAQARLWLMQDAFRCVTGKRRAILLSVVDCLRLRYCYTSMKITIDPIIAIGPKGTAFLPNGVCLTVTDVTLNDYNSIKWYNLRYAKKRDNEKITGRKDFPLHDHGPM